MNDMNGQDKSKDLTEQTEDEMKRADYWATMGVGSVGYFKI